MHLCCQGGLNMMDQTWKKHSNFCIFVQKLLQKCWRPEMERTLHNCSSEVRLVTKCCEFNIFNRRLFEARNMTDLLAVSRNNHLRLEMVFAFSKAVYFAHFSSDKGVIVPFTFSIYFNEWTNLTNALETYLDWWKSLSSWQMLASEWGKLRSVSCSLDIDVSIVQTSEELQRLRIPNWKTLMRVQNWTFIKSSELVPISNLFSKCNSNPSFFQFSFHHIFCVVSFCKKKKFPTERRCVQNLTWTQIF